MKKFLVSLFSVLLVAGGVGYLFQEELLTGLKAQITKDMFVAADADAFDPGVAVGSIFPKIKAVHSGRQIDSVESFSADKGMIFVANRSASW